MSPFPWHIVFWSVLGTVVLRPVFPDNGQYLLACFVYAVFLGVAGAVLESRDHNE